MKKIILFIPIVIVLIYLFFSYQKKETKILFVGDMFFDRHIRKTIYSKGEDHIFSCISDFLKEADFVVGNLEGPITENASVSLLSTPGSTNNFIFTFPTITAKMLADNNIKIVNLGNNHIGNFGREGLNSTKKHLEEAGVAYFGGLYGDEPVLRKDQLSFISYNEFGGENKEKVGQKIKTEKESGQIVVVYTHWGDEYSPVSKRIKDTAAYFSKEGADLLVGSHPHIVLPSEEISSVNREQKTTVYYSLGNFIFDQYWNKDVSTGLVLEVRVKDKKIEVTEHKTTMHKDGRVCLN